MLEHSSKSTPERSNERKMGEDQCFGESIFEYGLVFDNDRNTQEAHRHIIYTATFGSSKFTDKGRSKQLWTTSLLWTFEK